MASPWANPKFDLQPYAEIMVFAINHFGNGEHPEATPTNLTFFQTPYVKECLAKVMKSPGVTPDGKKLAIEASKILA